VRIEVGHISNYAVHHTAGADIMMALDDVVSSVDTSPERYPPPPSLPLYMRGTSVW